MVSPEPSPLLESMLGKTVVVDLISSYVCLGDFVGCDAQFLELRDADLHDLRDSSATREIYVHDSVRLGIRRNRARVLVRRDEIVAIARFDDIAVFLTTRTTVNRLGHTEIPRSPARENRGGDEQLAVARRQHHRPAKRQEAKSMRACVRRIMNIVDETAIREEDRPMNRNYRFSPLLLLALALPAVSRVEASEIRDRAGMFSPEAVKKAQAELDRIERKTRIPVVIETIDSIPGLDKHGSEPPPAERRSTIWPMSASRRSETRGFIC